MLGSVQGFQTNPQLASASATKFARIQPPSKFFPASVIILIPSPFVGTWKYLPEYLSAFLEGHD